MALALNIYKTKVGIATTTLSELYKAPVGYTGVILLSNITNVSENTETVTLIHNRVTNIAGTISTTVTEFFEEFPIEPNDAISAVKGKCCLEPGDSLRISASSNDGIKYIFSILETLN
jgi:hypothetical protein